MFSSSLQIACPLCGTLLTETSRDWRCSAQGCNFGVPHMIRQKMLLETDVADLVAKGRTRLIPGFQRRGNASTFSGCLVLESEGKVRLLPGEPTDFSCPQCASMILRFEEGYRCSNTAECGFILHRNFYGKKLTDAHMESILRNGTTDILHGFVSKKSGVVFSARIAIEKEVAGRHLKFIFPDDEKKNDVQTPRYSK